MSRQQAWSTSFPVVECVFRCAATFLHTCHILHLHAVPHFRVNVVRARVGCRSADYMCTKACQTYHVS
jgi:hypothetical protein